MSNAEARDRWSGRVAFILAAIGSAVGLGNFWRFPSLLYKNGGGVFLIPYTIAVFAIGIPIMQLEMTIGQIFQRGHAQAMAVLSPKGTGIGYSAAFGAFMICSYYMTIISWVCIYFIQSFQADLPWLNHDSLSTCTIQGRQVDQAEFHLFHNVLGMWSKQDNGICTEIEQADTGTIQWNTVASLMCCWVLVYLSVFKGASHTSKVVYVSVTLPMVLLLLLFFRAITLEGASLGIHEYIYKWDFTRLSDASLWVDAVSQVFFSLSLASGCMVTFGSYNPRTKPLLMDTFIIAISNSLFSIISGFVVWSTLGFYAHSQGLTIDELPSENLASLGLVFITYPIALGQIGLSQLWCALLFLCLFLLGIDSAFSLVEGIYSILIDTPLGQRFSRPVALLIICIPCALLGIFYSQNTGLFWFDVVDHYMQYLLLFIGSMQCMLLGWAKGTHVAERTNGPVSAHYFMLGYVLGICSFIGLSVSLANAFRTRQQLNDPNDGFVSYEVIVGLLVGACTLIGLWLLSYQKSGQTFSVWWQRCGLVGTLECSRIWLVLGPKKSQQCTSVYGVLWSILIKFVAPVSLLLLMVVGIRGDMLHNYGNLLDRYQILGWILLIIGMLLTLIPFVMLPFRPQESSTLLDEGPVGPHTFEQYNSQNKESFLAA